MINAIIIDDEQHCVDRLSILLSTYCSQSIHLAGSFLTLATGIRGIRKLQPDVIFLDVMLGEQTGFDLLEQLGDISSAVIFTTSYDKYAVQAFRFSAIDYLLKPVDPDDLKEAVKKLQEKISMEELSEKFDVLFHNLKTMQGASRKISIPTSSGLTFLQVSDIIRCQSDINYTTIYLKNKQKITVARTLKEFEELLTDYNFYRVHNSHLINLAYIKSYHKGKGGSVQMTDQSEIEVSTRRKENFLKKLSEM
ncbi:MAG TPA: LytTR family DNA-binding domain-containing protein [Balneolales bacterium]|nr:LytTR family DNA-binding domain-containing protein [Balneolales bacterium]